jgi:uncharacterized protein
MGMQTPFIHAFATPAAWYVYDFNTNSIIKTDQDVYKLFQYVERFHDAEKAIEKVKVEMSPDRVAKTIDFMQKAKEEGYFSPKRCREIEHYADSVYSDLTSSYMHHLILQITQNCNLHCDYCPYSGKYKNRSHANIDMPEEIAYKAIDFFLTHCIDSPKLSLSFYGGEPLLAFEQIKKVVGYFEEKVRGKEYHLSLTTNGTMLTEEKLRFLASKGFDLLISLDGPEHIHNQNRCFVSGNGSFEKVMTSLEMAERILPDYTRKKISINAVLDPESNFCAVNKFFTSYEAVKELKVGGAVVSTTNMKEEVFVEPDEAKVRQFKEEVDYESFKYFMSLSGRKIRHSSIIREWEEDGIRYIQDQRSIRSEFLERYHPSGPCIPGIFRLFVDVTGKFFPCERVCQVGDVCSVGDLEHGIDATKGRTFLNIGRLTEKQCLNCWAGDFCRVCVSHCHDGIKLDPISRLAYCNGVKLQAEEELIKFCVLKELEIQILDLWEVAEV